MSVLLEAASVFFMAIEGIAEGIITAVWNSLPAIIELRKITNLITPTNILASYVGIPATVISIVVFLATHVKLPQSEHS